jgi:hypothetical protein
MSTATDPASTAETAMRRIRGLLDQAENTPFPDEAETFAAKAAELMARHRIDQAMVDRHRRRRHGGIVELDIELGRGQYVRARLALLGAVASAFDCRLLTSSGPDGRTGHVIGHSSDAEQVSLLYTSLLVQATRAADVETTPRGQARVSFRRGFLLGFAQRVGDRLAEQMAAAVEQADSSDGDDHTESTGRSVALVLADRRSEVDAWVADRYGPLTRLGQAAPVHHEAVSRGAVAGDRADIGGRRVDGHRAALGR